MNEWQLRVLILLAGLVIIGLLYYFSTRHRQRRRYGDNVLPSDASSDLADDESDSDSDSDAQNSGADTDNTARAAASEEQQRPRPRPTAEPVLPEPSVPSQESLADGVTAADNIDDASSATISDEISRDDTTPSIGPGDSAAASMGITLPEPMVSSPASEPPQETIAARPRDGKPHNLVMLIQAPHGAPFRGLKLLTTLRDQDYSLNEKNTWDYCPFDAQQPLFSVGHLQEPGTFDIASMRELETPGLVLYMPIPRGGQHSAARAVTRMLDAAARLSEQLGGNLLDEDGQVMTLERQSEIRALAAAFDRRLGG